MSDEASKRTRNRRKAIDELLSTEKTYVDLMSLLVQRFLEPLKSKANILSADDYNTLFPADIRVILGLNLTFYKDLNRIINIVQSKSKSAEIGRIVKEFCPHFVSFAFSLYALCCVFSLSLCAF